MYYRIFSASPLLRYCVWVIAFGLVGWSIAVVGVSSRFSQAVRAYPCFAVLTLLTSSLLLCSHTRLLGPFCP